jgi:hypothetical protein
MSARLAYRPREAPIRAGLLRASVLLLSLIHRSAWNENSANFASTGF